MIALNAISNGTASTSVTAANFQSGVATTTSTTTNGTNVSGSLIGGTAYYVVGSQGLADWAAVSSTGTITTFTAANTAGYTTLLAGTTTGTNMHLDGGADDHSRGQHQHA